MSDQGRSRGCGAIQRRSAAIVLGLLLGIGFAMTWPREAHAEPMSRSYFRAARQEDWRAAVITRHANGQPRTLRLVRNPAQDAAYRRLALTILGLDVAGLAARLGHARI